ncbi:hypothetical protein [Mycobacteroides abscessus]|uniref:hypothetical protein n=1 Tax=Mycobacteroides abscessus TaxID=36809 RepID=UPI00266EC86C|nr:hypothetical protein [Mycobacteroides abscessus]MDO3107046.1 hypothetical protein [Mycobacteroides abscessus subsp. abscessus]
MTELHAVAGAFESAADTINHQYGYNLFDERRLDIAQTVAALHTYADDLRAATLTDPLPPIAQFKAITGALNSPEHEAAITLIRADYTRVRESDRFCTRLTRHGHNSTRVRVQHCESGIYLAGTHNWDGNHQFISSVSTNLAGKGEITDRACPVDEQQRPPFRHVHVPSWTSWQGIGGLQIWRYTRMGIGTRAYLRAHNIFPNARWKAGTLSDPAHGLRDALHRRNPWHWEAPHCPICGNSAAAQLHWADSTRHELIDAHAL